MRAELQESQVGPGAVLEVEGTAHRVVGTLHFDGQAFVHVDRARVRGYREVARS